MTWRAAWNVDCAARTYAVVCTGGSGGGGKLYLEAQGISFNSDAEVFIGIADASFALANPISFDVAPPQGPHCVGLTFKTSGQVPVGWGTPDHPATVATSTFATNDWMGIGINTLTGRLWWRNATASPSTWWGGTGSPDPVTGTDGFDVTGNLTGNIYVIVGAGNENTPGTNSILVNFGATAFAATKPTGWSAWDTTGESKFTDIDGHLTFATGALKITATSAIAGTNQPSAFARSNTYKARTA